MISKTNLCSALILASVASAQAINSAALDDYSGVPYRYKMNLQSLNSATLSTNMTKSVLSSGYLFEGNSQMQTVKVTLPANCGGTGPCAAINNAKYMYVEGDNWYSDYFNKQVASALVTFEILDNSKGASRKVEKRPGREVATLSDSRYGVSLTGLLLANESIKSVEFNFTYLNLTTGTASAPNPKLNHVWLGSLYFADFDGSRLFGMPIDDGQKVAYAGRENVLMTDIKFAMPYNSTSTLTYPGFGVYHRSGVKSASEPKYASTDRKITWIPTVSQVGNHVLEFGYYSNVRTYAVKVLPPPPVGIAVPNLTGPSSTMSLNAGKGAKTYSILAKGAVVASGNYSSDGLASVVLQRASLKVCKNSLTIKTCDDTWGCREDVAEVKNLGVCALPAVLSDL